MFCEPTSLTQKVAENLKHTFIITQAAQFEDQLERMAWLGAYFLSTFGPGMYYTRTGKPFNPLLGETYELISPDGWIFAE